MSPLGGCVACTAGQPHLFSVVSLMFFTLIPAVKLTGRMLPAVSMSTEPGGLSKVFLRSFHASSLVARHTSQPWDVLCVLKLEVGRPVGMCSTHWLRLA